MTRSLCVYYISLHRMRKLIRFPLSISKKCFISLFDSLSSTILFGTCGFDGIFICFSMRPLVRCVGSIFMKVHCLNVGIANAMAGLQPMIFEIFICFAVLCVQSMDMRSFCAWRVIFGKTSLIYMGDCETSSKLFPKFNFRDRIGGLILFQPF